MKSVIDRVQLKAKAKAVLKKYYWLLFIASLVVALLGGNSNYSSNGGGGSSNTQTSVTNTYTLVSDVRDSGYATVVNQVGNYGYSTMERSFFGRIAKAVMSFGIVVISLVIVAAAFCFTFLVSFPIKVGGSKVFVESADGAGRPDLRLLLFAFKNGRFKNTVKAGFLKTLYTFLWGLIFIIPGIVKSVAYSMTPYILADNPYMDASSAIRLSNEMTKGHKWDIFITEVSFIGWYLLGSVLFGLGVFFVNPYKDATMAQLYLALKGNAINRGIALPEHYGSTNFSSEARNEDVVDYRKKGNEN